MVFTKWPLHITLVPWFLYDGKISLLVAKINKKLKELEPFEVRVKDRKAFGPNKDIPVKLVEKTPQMMSLHARLYHLLITAGCKVESQEYNTIDYTPHITTRGDRTINSGVKLRIDAVYLIKDLQDGHRTRQIFKKLSLESAKSKC